jgi:hypothetical protein
MYNRICKNVVSHHCLNGQQKYDQSLGFFEANILRRFWY